MSADFRLLMSCIRALNGLGGSPEAQLRRLDAANLSEYRLVASQLATAEAEYKCNRGLSEKCEEWST